VHVTTSQTRQRVGPTHLCMASRLMHEGRQLEEGWPMNMAMSGSVGGQNCWRKIYLILNKIDLETQSDLVG
jgi:hypothetical protein